MKKPFDGFAIKRQQGKLFAIDFGGYETRNPSTLSLIQQAVDRHAVKDFGWIIINTMDREAQLVHEGLKVFAYSTATDNFAHVCPDFVYDHWRQTGLADYEETRLQLSAMTNPPATDMLGWRGAPTHPVRGTLVQFDDKKDFDCELIHWDRSDPNNLKAKNFVSFHDQIARWRYLIDIEGTGYSGRFKLLLSAPRVVFLQERLHKEDFFQYLVPWTHYVPVKRDLSDLRANLAAVKADPQLEQSIVANVRAFAGKYLTHASALERWAVLLNSQDAAA